MKQKKLKKVSNYAKEQGVQRTLVYYWINTGQIQSEVIDGAYFVVTYEAQETA